MTYYGTKELAASLRTVRNNTIRIAEDIPEAQYNYRATPDTRSVAETLVHIAGMARAQRQFHFADHAGSMEGFDLLAFIARLQEAEKKPRSKQEILEMLRSEGERLALAFEGVTEDFLAEPVQFQPGMTPPSRTRFDMLQSVKEHEMHHRAQLMLVERMLGITPHLTSQNEQRLAAMRAAQAAG